MTQDDKILKLPEVTKKTGLSRSKIYVLMDLGKFPQSIKLSTRSVGWSEKEINNWISNKLMLRPVLQGVRYDDR